MFNPTTLVGFHTWLSLIGIATGIPVVAALLANRTAAGWTAAFLITAIGTSVTGFLLPFTMVLPSHIVGALALVVLAVALAARFAFRLAGLWRGIYAACLVVSLYLLVFVGVAQAFAKIPALNALAPTPADPAFGAAQGVVLVVFGAIGFLSVRHFRSTLSPAR